MFLFIQLFKSLFTQMYYMYFYVLAVGIPILREQNEVAITRPLVWLFETMFVWPLSYLIVRPPIYAISGYWIPFQKLRNTLVLLILTYSS